VNVRLKAVAVSLLALAIATPTLTQVAPCGRNYLREGGDKEENRFIPAPLDHVKASLIKALPSVYGRLKKDEGNHLEAAIDGDLEQAVQKGFGSEGMKRGSTGTFHIDFSPDTKDGVAGTRVQVRFSKGIVASLGSGKYATPLVDETVCLVTLLPATDPTTNPSGIAAAPAAAQATPHPVTLKAGTAIKVALANYFYTKDVPKNTPEVTVNLEVVDDVAVDGIVVIRKGALVKGKVSSMSKSKSFGRNASFHFVIESATAVDGQNVPISNAAVVRKGTPGWQVATGVAFNGLAFGLVKGNESLVRAGTGWELPIEKDVTISAQ
jgi:hypothetical protein